MEGFRQGAFHFCSLSRCVSRWNRLFLNIALCARFAHILPMSSPPGGRTHLWFWVTFGVLLYAASCAPVEAWHERHYAQSSRTLPVGVAPGPATDAAGGGTSTSSTSAPAGTSAREGGFEIVELKYNEPPRRPVWMQIVYAPVHFAEKYPPFASIFQRYRLWCEEVF
jgi:hypothetical protein